MGIGLPRGPAQHIRQRHHTRHETENGGISSTDEPCYKWGDYDHIRTSISDVGRLTFAFGHMAYLWRKQRFRPDWHDQLQPRSMDLDQRYQRRTLTFPRRH
jgi:hypothetical protein